MTSALSKECNKILNEFGWSWKLKIDVRHGIIYVEREREDACFIRREKKNKTPTK